MKILVADYIYTPAGFLENQAILFDEVIVEMGSYETLIDKYPNVNVDFAGTNSVIYPGFINTHVHLEFSANKSELRYGSFVKWLDSVISNREKLMSECSDDIMRKACNDMLKSGITSFGAISSNGVDMQVCKETPQRVVYFNEVIGSNEGFNDYIFDEFTKRYEHSQTSKNDMLIPAVAIHSPYSVNKALVENIVSFAKTYNLLLTAHLLESKEEREWLENKSGELGDFLKEKFNATLPCNEINDFISLFDTINTHFVHCTNATKEELMLIKKNGHSIAHCPRSNRLLGCGRLAIEELIDTPMSIATDGLSSNWSLNIFDELRAALMMHSKGDLILLCNRLLKSITSDAANILSINCGILAPQMSADFAIINLPSKPQAIEPGIYLANDFGIRIEDTVQMKNGKAVVL